MTSLFYLCVVCLTFQGRLAQEDPDVPPEAQEMEDEGGDERELLMSDEEFKDMEKMGGLDGLPEIGDLPNMGGDMPDPAKVKSGLSTVCVWSEYRWWWIRNCCYDHINVHPLFLNGRYKYMSSL